MNRTYNSIYINKFLPPPGFEPGFLGTVSRCLNNFILLIINFLFLQKQVYPQIENGFIDREPVIREKTVIAMIHLAPNLNFANLDEGVVMKHFSRLLRDEQPGIRTNTTVCLGKVARYMHPSTRQKVLSSAFGGKV